MNPSLLPYVEIIMPIFNQKIYTEACVNSLYRNTDPKRFRLIAIDNASTDGVTDYLKDLSKKVDNLELIISDENLGWCKGLNRGFKQLKPSSDYILWANNDTLFESDWLDKMIKHFKGGVGAVGPTSNYVAGPQHIRYNHGHYEEISPLLIGFCLMFRREVINIVGDVDERFGLGGAEELDYLIRMKKLTNFHCVIARDVYIHHFGSRSLMELPEISRDQNAYLEYCRQKDVQLEDKWGKEEVGKYLGYPESNGIIICVPNPGFVKTEFWKDTINMGRLPGTEICEATMESNVIKMKNEVIDFERPSDIADFRNTLVRYAKQGGFRKVLFIDSDMRVPSNAIFRLMDMDAPIVAGYFFSRNHPHFPCAFQWNEKGQGYESIYKPNSGVIDVDAVGAAFTMYDLRLFDEMPEPWFHKDKFGEDITLCHKAKKIGVRILVDTDLVIKHIGEEKEIGPEDYVQ